MAVLPGKASDGVAEQLAFSVGWERGEAWHGDGDWGGPGNRLADKGLSSLWDGTLLRPARAMRNASWPTEVADFESRGMGSRGTRPARHAL